MKTARAVLTSLCMFIGCERNQKLSDDLEWMNNTYDGHENHLGHGRSGWYSRENGAAILTSGSAQSIAADGCKITTWIEPNPVAQMAQNLRTETILKFNLKTIDPETIKVKTYSHFGGFACEQYSAEERQSQGIDCDNAEMTASTRNARNAVEEQSHSTYPKLSGKDHEAYGKSTQADVYFGFDDVDYANQFAKVFRDAVIQCGGTRGAGN